MILNHECTFIQKHPIAHAGLETDQTMICGLFIEMAQKNKKLQIQLDSTFTSNAYKHLAGYHAKVSTFLAIINSD